MLTDTQLQQYQDDGYVIVDCPWLVELTERCMDAVRKVEVEPAALGVDGKNNHARLKPQMPDSYWCELDHSLPFLNVILHPELVSIGRQITGDDDIYMRNAGINDMAVGKAVSWHRDYQHEELELMHYFSGGKRINGCLRVVPGSHIGPQEDMMPTIKRLRREQGIPEDIAGYTEYEDAVLPGEVTLEVEPHQIIVRRNSLYHANHLNKSTESRLMSHWIYRPSDADDHRITWDDYLTDDLIASLTPEQRDVLWLGRDYEIAEKFRSERERELGKVSWGIV